jgi:hypothetical protein
MQYDAIGPTAHLASRMEQLAVPGTIRLTQSTLHLAEGFVRVNPLGPVPVKGLELPIEIYELQGAAPTRSRFQVAVARGLARFVGRDTEIEALGRALDRSAEGHGQVFAIIGDPGVGKSRLVYEFTRSHRTAGMLVLESRSVSYGRATTYLPVIDLLKAYYQIDDRDDARRIREKVIGKLLILDEGLRPAAPALLSLLDVPVVDDSAWSALEPSQRRRRTLEAIRAVLLRESEVQPLVVVFEDLHWVDSETQAFLDSLVESLPTARILLLVNYRPEYQHGWASRSYYAQRRIDTLPPQNAAELLHGLLGDDPSLARLKEVLLKRGNPFFLEETVRTLVETKSLERRARCLSPHPPRSGSADPAHGAGHSHGADRPSGALRQAAPSGRRGGGQGCLLRNPAGHRGAAGGRAASGTGRSPGARIPVRGPPVPGPRVHLQARAHPRGYLRKPAGRAAPSAARAHSGRHLAALS